MTRCLAFKRTKNNGKNGIYQEFKDQVGWSRMGWYETSFLWKANSDELPTNKPGSLSRFRVLLKKLKKNTMLFDQYNEIIRDQLAQGIVEKIPNGQPNIREFY